MLPNFLCQTHRQHFQQNPNEAVSAWDNWMSEGHQSSLNHDVAKAFSYYGSSMEVAEILIYQGANMPLNAITAFERFQLAGQHLAQLCQRHNYKDMAVVIMQKLNDTLTNQGYSPTTTTANRTTKAENADQYNHLMQYPSSGRIH
jgi:hypothetical protein